MTLQFRQKSQTSRIQQLEQEVKQLRDTVKNMQEKYQIKQQQCVMLQESINQLKDAQKAMKSDYKPQNQHLMESKEYLEIIEQYKEITHQCIDIKIKYDRLLHEFQELSSAKKRQESSQIELKKDIEVLKNIVRNQQLNTHQLIYEKKNMQKDIENLEKQLTELRNSQNREENQNRQILAFMSKIEDFEKQLQTSTKNRKKAHEKQVQLELKIKDKEKIIQQLQKELKNKEKSLKNADGSPSNDSLHYQILVLETKNSQLKRQLDEKKKLEDELWAKEEEIKRMTEVQGKTSDHEIEISMLQIKIDDLEQSLKEKEQLCYQKQNALKNLQKMQKQNRDKIVKIQIQITEKDFLIQKYQAKISVLSEELDRLVHKIQIESQKQKLRSLQFDNTQLLKTKLEKLQMKNAELQQMLSSLTYETERKILYIRDLEHRNSMLEEGNLYLEKQLSRLVEEGKSISRLLQNKNQQDEAYKKLIISLKSQIERSKELNNLLRTERDELQNQLQQTKSKLENSRSTKRDRSRSHSPHASRSSHLTSKIASRIDRVTLNSTPETVDSHSDKRQYVPISPLDYDLYKKNFNNPEPHQKFSHLQMRIRELQNENSSLKKARY